VNYVFQFNIVWDHLPELLEGALLTIRLSATAMALGLCLALLCAYGQSAGPRPVRWLVASYVELIRNTPFLVQIFFLYFALPQLGLKLNPTVTAIIALGLNGGAYAIEIIRGGVQSIDKGQVEASQALGMTYQRLMRRIVIPQALMRMIPGILNQFVTCFKSTSIVSVIAVPDLMYQAGLIVSMTFLPMPVYSFVALLYFLMVMVIALGVRLATRHLPQFGYFHQLHGTE